MWTGSSLAGRRHLIGGKLQQELERQVCSGCTPVLLWMVPSSAQSLLPKNTATADMLLSAELWQPMSRGKRILAHLELYPDSPLFTTSHFLETKYTSDLDTVDRTVCIQTSKRNRIQQLWVARSTILDEIMWGHLHNACQFLTFVVCGLFPRPSHSFEMNTERLSIDWMNLTFG